MVYPDPVPLSSSMASLEDGKWNKLGIKKQVLRSKLVEDCLRSVISTGKWTWSNKPESEDLSRDAPVIELSSIGTIGVV